MRQRATESRPIIKVDRIASVSEAVSFQAAGANLIGIELDPNPRFEDTRAVTPELAQQIRTAVAPAGLVGLVPTYFLEDDPSKSRCRIERMVDIRPDYLQVYRGHSLAENWHLICETGIPLIRSGAVIDEDQGMFMPLQDRPGFVRDQLADSFQFKPTLFELEVIPTMVDPWLFLTEEAPHWPDSHPQLADIAEITHDLPFLLSLVGLSPATICPYVRAFPAARGFYAPLGPGDLTGPLCTRPEPLLAALHALTSYMDEQRQ